MGEQTRITELQGEPTVSSLRAEVERMGIAESADGFGVSPARIGHLLNAYGIRLFGYTSLRRKREYASVLTRLSAILIDTLFVVPFYIPIYFIEDDSEDLTLLLWLISLLLMVGFVFWNTIVRMGRTGQSLGRKFLDMALLDGHGNPIGVGRTFLREVIGRWLSGVVCYIG